MKGRVILSRQHSKPAFSDRLSLIPTDSGRQAQIQGPRMKCENKARKQQEQQGIWSRRCPARLLINMEWHDGAHAPIQLRPLALIHDVYKLKVDQDKSVNQ